MRREQEKGKAPEQLPEALFYTLLTLISPERHRPKPRSLFRSVFRILLFLPFFVIQAVLFHNIYQVQDILKTNLQVLSKVLLIILVTTLAVLMHFFEHFTTAQFPAAMAPTSGIRLKFTG